ncbi:MAG: hypothetical protein HYV90_01115 [Candidatus Woesebacteria bacterium]|nr:MAG: hypothetical protein HYV90_01115 [Candidatus Woesebacteria bacterium]
MLDFLAEQDPVESDGIITKQTAVWVKTYDSAGKATRTVRKTGDHFIKESFEVGRGTYRRFAWTDPDYPVEALTPIFAEMGAEGWEVVDFKFASGLDSFANALLKRKVQKE